jgi:hypothetical protein
MARHKASPHVLGHKRAIASRLRLLREELFGERGGPELARRLDVPVRTWYNYELGVTLPAEVLLRLIELTRVSPDWLLRGEGERWLRGVSAHEVLKKSTVRELLNTALSKLDARERLGPNAGRTRRTEGVWARVVNRDEWPGGGGPSAVPYPLVDRLPVGGEGLFVLVVSDEEMAPAVPLGSLVYYRAGRVSAETLDGRLVVADVAGRPCVRWLQMAGHVALLRSESRELGPQVVTVSGDDGAMGASLYAVDSVQSPREPVSPTRP